MAKDKRLIDAEPIKKFIVDGLNNPDPKKAFGHDAIEILTEIEYAPTVDAVEVVYGWWIPVPSSDMMTGKAYKCSECNKMRYGSFMPNYCQNCGAKMDGERKGNGC